MRNYLAAECYKTFRRKYFYIILAVCLGLEAVLLWGYWTTWKWGNSNVDFYKNNTLKNEVSYGLSRGRIYLGKLLVSTGIAVLAAVVMMGFYLGLCWVLFPHTELDGMAWQLIGYCLAGAFPLWLAAQAMVNTCYFLVRGTNIAAFTAAGLLAVLPAILQAFGILFHPAFEVLRQFMPGIMLENLKNMAFQWNYVGLCWAGRGAHEALPDRGMGQGGGPPLFPGIPAGPAGPGRRAAPPVAVRPRRHVSGQLRR